MITKSVSIITGKSKSLWWKQKVSWTNILGDTEEVEAEGETLEIAIERAFIKAQSRGWTPRRWWQFWRWQDTPDVRGTLNFYGK